MAAPLPSPTVEPAAPRPPSPRFPARALILVVRGYQKTLSPLIPAVLGASAGCRFYPTCSHYACQDLATHGALRGSWLSLRRLVRCTPLSAGGFDPVPPPRKRRQTPTCVRA